MKLNLADAGVTFFLRVMQIKFLSQKMTPPTVGWVGPDGFDQLLSTNAL